MQDVREFESHTLRHRLSGVLILTDPQLLELALQPFRALEELAIPAAYERSAKFECGLLTSQRYLLGVPTTQVESARLIEAARRLNPPSTVLDRFRHLIVGASTVLFGFEGDERGAVFKLYTEHLSRVSTRSSDRLKVDLFTGFKWDAVAGKTVAETRYRYSDRIEITDLHEKIDSFLSVRGLEELRLPASELTNRVAESGVSFDPFWLEISEVNQPIRAFDINCYPAGLFLGDVGGALMRVSKSFGVGHDALEKLLDVAGAFRLGHLSAGESRQGQSFFTVYFEPVDHDSRFKQARIEPPNV